MTLRAYVFKLMLQRTIVSAVILLAILQILDLLDITTPVLDRGLGLPGLLHYSALRLPALFRQIAPLSVLVGVIFCYLQLARDNAVVAMRAAGVSLLQLILMGAPVAGGMAALDFAVVEFVAPKAQSSLDNWWASTAPPSERPQFKARPFRVGADIVLARQGDQAGSRLDDVRIYRRGVTGQLSERIVSASAIYTEQGWRLHQPMVTRIGEAVVTTSAPNQVMWRNSLDPRAVRTLFAPNQPLSANDARRALTDGVSEKPEAYYLTQLHRALAEPLGALVMLLLASPVAFANFRSGNGVRFVIGAIGAGLIYLVVDGVMTAMAETGATPSLLGAWFAPVIFAAGGLTALLYLEA
jgi:lipopolysaccharide export system permease protein